MSRLAKTAIVVPPKTEAQISGDELRITGPKGTLTRKLNRHVSITVSPDGIQVLPKGKTIESRASIGTYAAHVRNMLHGVHEGFTKKLLVEGVGYKWEVAGKQLTLSLGFSHPVKKTIPEGLTVTAEKNSLTISGFDKELVGQFAANIRALKKPEPYKGKGIRYDGEVIRRKQGKKAA